MINRPNTDDSDDEQDENDNDEQTGGQTLRGLYDSDVSYPIGTRIGAFVLFTALIYVWRPIFHGLFYGMRYSLSGLVMGLILVPSFLFLWFAPRIPTQGDFAKRSKSIAGKSSIFIMLWVVVGIVLFIAGVTPVFTLIVLSLIVVGLGVISGILLRSHDEADGTIVVVSFILIFFTALIIGSVSMAALVQQREMAMATMDGAEEVGAFPEVNADNPRIISREVDKKQAKGSVSYRQHHLGSSDIARGPNGSLTWSYPIEPDGFRNSIIENQRGIALSDMTSMSDRNFSTYDDTEFAVGEGMFLHRGATWNLRKTDYWAKYNDDSVDFIHDGEPHMLYPKTGHEWNLELVGGIIPIPYTVPKWNGVALIEPSGDITNMSPEEARQSEVTKGQRLFPFDVGTKYIKSLGYRNGIINQMPVVGAHEDEVEVADLPSGAGNSQPFLVDMEDEQFSYIMALEPYGSDTRGLDEVWFMNGRTGKYTYFSTGEDTLFGPERAMGIVRSEDTRTGWGDNFEVVEPIPTIISGDLYWHSKVVPTDNLDVARNVFVNAETGWAVEATDTESVVRFINQTGNVTEVVDEIGEGQQNEGNQTGSDGDVEPPDNVSRDDTVYIVTVRDENGTVVERIPVAEDQEVNIESAQNESGE